MHYSELGQLKTCGGKAQLALDWVRTLLDDPTFEVRVRTLLVDCREFEMKWYGNSRDTAINRQVKTYILGSLALYCDPDESVDLRINIDGHSTAFKTGSGLIDYLADAIDYASRRRSQQPNVQSVKVRAIPRKPLSPRGPGRRRQDLIALADTVAGAIRLHSAGCGGLSPHSAKRIVAEKLDKGMRRYESIPVMQRPVETVLYTPPGDFESIVPLRKAKSLDTSLVQF